jgi:hypothetical protein
MGDDNLAEDLAALEALEALPQRPLTPTERTHKHRRKWGPDNKKGFEAGYRDGGQESFIDLYNRLVAQYGPAVADGMIEGGFHPYEFIAAELHLLADLDLWCEATGESRAALTESQRLGLEAWLWETHDRARDPDRRNPNKSPDHDAPWPGAPERWAPRRWFCWSRPSWLPGAQLPGRISIARALNAERALTRALLADTSTTGEFNCDEGGEWDYAETKRLVSERNHPKPQGFWSVKWNGIEQRADWRDKKWESCIDEQPPESVLLQTCINGWAYEQVEKPAQELSERRKECERRRQAAIDGLLSNFGCAA